MEKASVELQDVMSHLLTCDVGLPVQFMLKNLKPTVVSIGRFLCRLRVGSLYTALLRGRDPRNGNVNGGVF